MPNIAAIGNKEQVRNSSVVNSLGLSHYWDYLFFLGLRHTIHDHIQLHRAIKGIWKVLVWKILFFFCSSRLVTILHISSFFCTSNDLNYIVWENVWGIDTTRKNSIRLQFFLSLVSIVHSFVGFSADDIIESLLDNGGAAAATTCDRAPLCSFTHTHAYWKRIHERRGKTRACAYRQRRVTRIERFTIIADFSRFGAQWRRFDIILSCPSGMCIAAAAIFCFEQSNHQKKINFVCSPFDVPHWIRFHLKCSSSETMREKLRLSLSEIS